MKDSAPATDPQAPAWDAEAALLRAYAAGDPAAARDLTLRLAPRALAQAQRMLADRAEAEDMVQEALLRLWRAAGLACRAGGAGRRWAGFSRRP